MADMVMALDGKLFGGWLYSGTRSVFEHQALLNRINVFPVPDGDTGTNMVATLVAASGPFRTRAPEAVSEAARQAAEAALNGARGNSGAIVAQFLHGFASGVRDLASLGALAFADAARRGTEAAYRALRRPQEGTILSVLKAWADSLAEHSRRSEDLAEIMERALGSATTALEMTPKQLQVLADNGVVDAGGQGLVQFLRGASAYLRDRAELDWELPTQVVAAFPADGPDHGRHETSHRFCSEALLDGDGTTREELFEALDPLGDSMVIAGGQRRLRIHLHTDEPRRFFDELSGLGTLAACKVDDMWLQQVKRDSAAVALVTDSTCDLPELEALGLHVYTVPLSVRFGDEHHRDGEDLAPAAFFQKLQSATELPTTSQPAAGDFQRIYRTLLERYDAIVSVHIAEAISGTFQAARAAAEQVDSDRIGVIDSRQVSVGLGLVASALGQAIAGGEGLEGLVAAAETVRENVRIFGSTPTLAHAVRGGRVDAKVAWVLERLGLKPLIHFDEFGKPYKGGVTVGFKAAMRKLARQAAAWAGPEPVRALVVHADAPVSGTYLAGRAAIALGLDEVPIVPAGSVLGNHVGPGAVALAVQRGSEVG